jgi:predicted porin
MNTFLIRALVLTLEKFAMKKSLIALATLAAVSGTAFAQSSVSLSGKLRYAYESTESAAGAKANGFKVTDGDFGLKAVEDLGGGLKVTASMAVQSRGRGTDIKGRDASLTLSGGFGSVFIGSIEAGNGIIGLGGAGAPVYGLDNGTTLAGAGNVDIIKYSLPAFSGVTLSVNATDAVATLGQEAAAETLDTTGFGVNYAAGPLAVAADLTNYGANASGSTLDSRTRISASYNLGMAKIGAGIQMSSTTTNVDTTQQIFGVSVPMGAITLGLNVASSKTDGVTGTNKGTDLGAKYALSKRTYVAAQYQTTKAAGATASANKFRIQLAHSF